MKDSNVYIRKPVRWSVALASIACLILVIGASSAHANGAPVTIFLSLINL